jgi:hypothetical protein
MENRRHVTEEDLLITEALIAKSYGQLKQSVIQAPSHAFKSVGKTVHEHPFATAGLAVITGVAVYGIFKMMTSRTSAHDAQAGARVMFQKDRNRPDLIQELLPMILPLVAPYFMGYIQKYLGMILSKERS